jgi:hypothetical protein
MYAQEEPARHWDFGTFFLGLIRRPVFKKPPNFAISLPYTPHSQPITPHKTIKY